MGNPLEQHGISLPAPFEHLRLLGKVDEGGFGLVYHAYDEKERSPVAIKFFRDSATFDYAEASFGMRIRAEQFGACLGVLDLARFANQGWPSSAIVMEFLPVTLKEVLRDATALGFRFSVGQISQWARSLVRGLEIMHDRVHRDVKPTNIMFRMHNEACYSQPSNVAGAGIVLTDFGTIAKVDSVPRNAVDRHFQNGAPDPFKDPVLYNAEPQIAHPAMDIYAFGMVLREFAKICEGDTKWLEDVAKDCTQPEIDARPEAKDLFHRLAPDWDVQIKLLSDVGYRPEAHKNFVGREWIFEDFEAWQKTRTEQGGIYAVMGPPGIGKTALLTRWPQRAGQPFAFYFRYRDNRTTPADMPRALARQLKSKFGVEYREPQHDLEWTAILESMVKEVMSRPEVHKPLILFVDGLDECADPSQAVGFLPKELPAGAFVITSTRPAKDKAKDHVATLRTAGAKIFEILPGDERNLADVRKFLGQRLKDHGTPGEIDQLADHIGGIFLLAVLVSEGIEEKRATMAETLIQSLPWKKLDPEKRLFAYYQETWQRICGKKTDDSTISEKEQNLANFATLMAAIFSWISEDQIAKNLEFFETESLRRTQVYWHPTNVRATIPSVTWFVEHQDGAGIAYSSSGFNHYQIRHQSARDFLLSPEGPVPDLALCRMHVSMGDFYQREARSVEWNKVDPYGRWFVVKHLLATKERKSLVEGTDLLSHMRYLRATLGNKNADSPPDENKVAGAEA